MTSVGIVYDLRTDYLEQGWSEKDVAEFDSADTIDALQRTIEGLGYKAEKIGNGERLCRLLIDGRRWDMIFNISESFGGRCRESQVPALLEMFGVPYTFSDPLVCAATLDKSIAKRLVAQRGLATPPFHVIEDVSDIDDVNLKYPVFAKPLAEGTGKGVDHNSLIDDPSKLERICADMLEEYAQPVLVEEYLPGREFTVGILGCGRKAWVLGTMEIEIRGKREPAVYSYTNKEECESRILYRPLLDDPRLKEHVEDLALESYRVLQCRDGGRVDIRCDAEGKPSFMEINPLPGLHPTHSDLPMIATQEGLRYEELIGTIIDSAFSRVRQNRVPGFKTSAKTSFGFEEEEKELGYLPKHGIHTGPVPVRVRLERKSWTEY